MKQSLIYALCIFIGHFLPSYIFSQNMETPFEKNPASTATYEEIITYFHALDAQFPEIQFTVSGTTDIGMPLHTVVVSTHQYFTPEAARKNNQCVWLINNGIHPGEPEGIDATMMFVRDCLTNPTLRKLLDNVVMVIIPVYNVDGCLNRGEFSRANQAGPLAYGFRGNARNLDLNRDFIKADSRNAQSFQAIFTHWNPDFFVDNHTSNGADYPYTMTLIPTHADKLAPELGAYLKQEILPFLYKEMATRNCEMTPYVNAEETPDKGIYGFMDSPRYSTGYAALHHTIGFMPETHMLKPFPARVKATYVFMEVVLGFLANQHEVLRGYRKIAVENVSKQTVFPLKWALSEDKVDSLLFKGYTAAYKPSEVSGLPRLYYDQSQPYTQNIPYWNTYHPTVTASKPDFYIIPQAYTEIAEKLENNGIEVSRLENDSAFEVEMYYIRDYKSVKQPYEGHFLHVNVEVEKIISTQRFRKNDFYVSTAQKGVRFIIETLEPQGIDSYFAWNFFDGILQQKEHFSDYVFEDLAAKMLKDNPKLKEALVLRQQNDPAFAQDANAQLEFIYIHSPYYERTHNLCPIARGVKQ